MLGGRYTLLNELGTGGMAVVWRARDEVLGRSVAVKLLAGRYAGDPQSRARIRDEARAAATLSHPNIAQVYDFGESDENGHFLSYVVMELVHGITLQQRVKSGMLAPKQIFHIGAQVASALAAAHADGLVHRDIKPANVMVTQDGAKVVDFGIAAAVGPGDPRDEVLGTPAYLAPERLTGDAVEPASDVYALGVLLYRLLAGESPWTVDSTTQMLEAHVYVEPTPLPALPEVPAEVTSLINRCLRKDTAGRPTAAEVSAVLAGAADNRPGLLPAPALGEGAGLLAVPDGGGSGFLAARRDGAALGDRSGVSPESNDGSGLGDGLAPSGGSAPSGSHGRLSVPRNGSGPGSGAAPGRGAAHGSGAASQVGSASDSGSVSRFGSAPSGSPSRDGSAAGGKPRELIGASAVGDKAAPATAAGVMPAKRKRLVAAGAAAVLVAGVAAWMLVPAGGAEGEPGGSVAVLPSAPASTTGLGAPAGDVTKPAAVAPESERSQRALGLPHRRQRVRRQSADVQRGRGQHHPLRRTLDTDAPVRLPGAHARRGGRRLAIHL